MSACNDGFQELQALQQQKDEALARAARIEAEINRRQSGTTEMTGDAALVQRGLDDVVARLSDDGLKEWVQAAMETKKRTNISSGGAQPNNFDQLIRSADIRTAQDYAALSKALLDTGVKLNPEQFKFVNQTYGREFVTQQVMTAYKELVGTDKLGLLLAQDVAPFMHLVERMTRLRVAAAGFRKSLMEDIRQIAVHRSQNASPVPADLKRQIFESYKKALLTERHVDLARSRTGQTLRSLQDDLPDLDALRTQLETGELFAPDPEMVNAELGLKPSDIQASELLGDVMQAIDDTNAARGSEALRQIALVVEMEGANPKSRLRDHKWFNRQMKLGNLLAKDSQLTNFNTQVVANGGSNAVMMLVGPMRQAFENIGALTPYGTRLSRDAWQQGFASSWAGVKQAMDVVRSSGKEVFMDALVNGRSVFAGNKDTFGKELHVNDRLVVQLQSLIDMPFQGKWMLNPINVGLARNKIHASIRLWLYEKTGNGFLMEPGLRMLGAVDNVAGLYHHAFKVRNDLEVRVRRDGAQLGLLDQQSMDDWIDAEFNKAFYSLEPSEADVKAYRRELGLTGEISDDDIKIEIINKRLGETYGAPTFATPESINAEQYSRELRFQNTPGDLRPESTRGQLAGAAYEGMQKARSNWLADFTFPYLQSPLLGTFMDMNHIGITPAIDTLSMWMNPAGFTPAQKARVKANWIVAGTIWGSFFALDSQGLIIGNGPIDPKERQEWEADLKRRGLVPNSIAGVPLMGGVPVINTLFLLKDLKEAFIRGNVSKMDQNNAFLAGMQVLTGQLMRQTSLGQFKQLMDIILSPTQQSKQRQAVNTVGYMGGGQIPGVGILRDISRLGDVSSRTYYQSEAPTPAEQSLAGPQPWEQAERLLRDLASGAIPITNVINGVRQTTDWLGSPINLPFGMRYVEALKHRFFPQVWPDDKVYAELDKQNLLNPPPPLMDGYLDGLAMSAELQAEYNQLYSTTKGDSMVARLSLAGSKPSFSISFPYRVELEGTGITYDRSTKLIGIEVAPFLEKHVRGKTVLEAMRSVINSPLYQELQRLPGTTSDYEVRDMSPQERRGQPGQILLKTVKNYYALLAQDGIGRSDSPDAKEWRELRAEAMVQRQGKVMNQLNGLEKALQMAQ